MVTGWRRAGLSRAAEPFQLGMRKTLELSPEAIELVAARFKVMGEPFRLRLMQALDHGEKSIGELALELASSQPNVSKHAKILHGAGLIDRRQEGNTVYCSIADPSVYDLCEVVRSSLRGQIEKQNHSLSARRAARPTTSRR
jgi:DNA-binding transcriptional ArsR family regulator